MSLIVDCIWTPYWGTPGAVSPMMCIVLIMFLVEIIGRNAYKAVLGVAWPWHKWIQCVASMISQR